MELKPAIELRNITKTFGSVVANKNVNLTVNYAEILSILGENGSGKTTLMNMISGIYYPDEGQISINGEEVVISSPKDAFNYKIGMIHQHFKLVDVFSATENIILGLKGKGRYNPKDAAIKIKEISDKYGFEIDPSKKIHEMSVSEKQTVEIIKVLYRGADILILDEPTAVLTPQETDNHKPEFYLQQIPKTDADFVRSNQQIADALYNMVYIYRDGLGDQHLSDEAFEDFCRRFPNDPRLLDLYYMQYLTALKDQRTMDAERYRADILRLFPESQEAYIVSQPDYFDRLRRMAAEQDSIYESTYESYRNSDFAAVKSNKSYVEDNYPLTPLMPRFLFLNAIAVAKTDGQEAFATELRDMVTRYPDNELAAMAKDMLALMGQGAESQVDGEMASLQERRAEGQTDELAQDTTITFSAERQYSSFVLLIIPHDEKRLNTVLYEVALYNFTQFMIRDFDLKQIPMFVVGKSALQVAGFDSLDDAEWYASMLKKNLDIMQVLKDNEVEILCITQTNYDLIGKHFTLDEYLEWQIQ